MARNSKKAADQFAALSIDPADYTAAMTLAVAQQWTNLPVDTKSERLRQALATVEDDLLAALPPEKRPLPDADLNNLLAATPGDGLEVLRVENDRLKRNLGVQMWRHRTRLQAALDARTLRYVRRTKAVTA